MSNSPKDKGDSKDEGKDKDKNNNSDSSPISKFLQLKSKSNSEKKEKDKKEKKKDTADDWDSDEEWSGNRDFMSFRERKTLTPQEVRSVWDQEDRLPLEERRKRYRCKSGYIEEKDIRTWHDIILREKILRRTEEAQGSNQQQDENKQKGIPKKIMINYSISPICIDLSPIVALACTLKKS